MEGHPIPQDITGFQFKLIGDMTIKQFAYVAFGAVIAWLIFSSSIPGFIKLPIAAFFALFGAGLAFLPIGGRPMDTMVLNFAKALFNPSKYIYQKSNSNIFTPAQQVTTPITPPQPKEPAAGVNQDVFFSQPQTLNIQTTTPKIGEIGEHEKPEEEKKLEEKEKEDYLEKETENVQKELTQAKAEEETEKNTPSYETAHQKVLELEKLLEETVSQRQELERQIMQLQNKLTTQNQSTFTPTVMPVLKETKNVRSVPSSMGKSIGIPAAPEFPNLLIGIIKDARGNPLPNILVEVKDKEGNPARAFKTNGLGQFASATPLTNGTYRIEFEDQKGQVKFDAVEISATGEIILPIEIIGTDQREELRKSLFNQVS